MTGMVVYPSTSQYFLSVNLDEMTLEERGVLLTGQRVAEVRFDGKFRRDKQPMIKHSRALALKTKELNLSVVAQVLAWSHDLCEDCGMTPDEVGEEFGPVYGPTITFGIGALTHREDESVEDYFGRIIEASKVNFEIIVVKVIDRWHFHLCPYGDHAKWVVKEIAKATETTTCFQKMCAQCRPFIPEHFIAIYDGLVAEVLTLARTKLSELGEIVT